MGMTREVVEKIVRGITDKIECNTVDIDDWAEFWGFTRDEYEEFLDMAIKALEQRPCEDYISRESLKQKLQEHRDFFINDYSGFRNLPSKEKARVDEIDNCIAMVVNESSVTPQPKTGHWEYVQYDSNPSIGNWHCSECMDICTKMHSIEDAYNYCPNCGARMEGKE